MEKTPTKSIYRVQAMPVVGMVPAAEEATTIFLRKAITMNRYLAFVLVAALGVSTIGCESKNGTSENTTQTTTTQTEDGEITGETTTTTTDTTTTTPPVTPDVGGKTTERTDPDDDRDEQVIHVMHGRLLGPMRRSCVAMCSSARESTAVPNQSTLVVNKETSNEKGSRTVSRSCVVALRAIR